MRWKTVSLIRIFQLSSTPNRVKIPGDRRLFQIFIEPKKIKDLIKFPPFVKIKITSQALKMKCLFNNIFWGFYLNYEELKPKFTLGPYFVSYVFILTMRN